MPIVVPAPGLVLDHERLAERRGQVLGGGTGDNVDGAARGDGDNHADRLGRPSLRMARIRHER